MARTPSDPVAGLLDWAGTFAGGFGRRLVIHLCALIAAAIISASMNKMALPPMGTGAVAFTAYIGLICLIPRGRMQSMAWIVPTAAGFAQTLLWTIWGVPWQTTFLPAGLLTWGIRAITMKGDMGWEWSVLPWLLIGLYLFLDDLAPLSLYSIPYWTVPLLIAVAWGVLKVHRSIRFDAIHRDILKEAVERLEELSGKEGLPDALRASVRRLAEQGARFAQKAPRFDDAALALVLDYEKSTNALTRLGTRSIPADEAVTTLSARVQKLNDALEQRLAPLTPASPMDPVRAALEQKLDGFTRNAEELGRKQYLLTEDLRPHIASIQQSAEKIMASMRDDPRDVPQGDKFLARYLPAAHKIIDEHVRLAAQGESTPGVAAALERSKDMLARLDTAFRDEHAALLENDTLAYTAELNVLDKLLKMDGR